MNRQTDTVKGTGLKVFRYIKKNPDATVRQLVESLGLSSESVAQHHLVRLQRVGWIQQQPRWKITRSNVARPAEMPE